MDYRIGFVALLVAGCQPVQRAEYPMVGHNMAGYYQPYAPQNYNPPNYAPISDIEPAAGVAERAPSPDVLREINQIGERIQRVEKAMLRLDRRMQLVERNELGRMGDGPGLSSVEPAAIPTVGPAYDQGFRPVSAITSSLQAASGPVVREERLAVNRLPSLADEPSAVGDGGDLAVWTVKYAQDKIWPERDQLPMSRDVVEALRSGKKVTVFARGKHPQAQDFRERVKALSRYLGKVSSLESVPIAAIPAPHLGDHTIEIFATY